MNSYSERFQALLLSTGFKSAPEILRALWRKAGGVCALCGDRIPPITDGPYEGSQAMRPSVDHIVPLVCGGSNEMENLQIAHQECNSLRGIFPMTHWHPEIVELMRRYRQKIVCMRSELARLHGHKPDKRQRNGGANRFGEKLTPPKPLRVAVEELSPGFFMKTERQVEREEAMAAVPTGNFVRGDE